MISKEKFHEGSLKASCEQVDKHMVCPESVHADGMASCKFGVSLPVKRSHF
jgi:hypothetical protein